MFKVRPKHILSATSAQFFRFMPSLGVRSPCLRFLFFIDEQVKSARNQPIFICQNGVYRGYLGCIPLAWEQEPFLFCCGAIRFMAHKFFSEALISSMAFSNKDSTGKTTITEVNKKYHTKRHFLLHNSHCLDLDLNDQKTRRYFW